MILQKKALKVCESGQTIDVNDIWNVIFLTWKCHFLNPIIQAHNVCIEDSKIYEIDFGTVFWDTLTLHPISSKSTFPTTGTFRYGKSHYLLFIDIIVQTVIWRLPGLGV